MCVCHEKSSSDKEEHSRPHNAKNDLTKFYLNLPCYFVIRLYIKEK